MGRRLAPFVLFAHLGCADGAALGGPAVDIDGVVDALDTCSREGAAAPAEEGLVATGSMAPQVGPARSVGGWWRGEVQGRRRGVEARRGRGSP